MQSDGSLEELVTTGDSKDLVGQELIRVSHQRGKETTTRLFGSLANDGGAGIAGAVDAVAKAREDDLRDEDISIRSEASEGLGPRKVRKNSPPCA